MFWTGTYCIPSTGYTAEGYTAKGYIYAGYIYAGSMYADYIYYGIILFEKFWKWGRIYYSFF